jgi:hypothetical protein
MSRLKPTKDNRTSYDKKTGAVRSIFGSELVEPVPEAKRGLTTEGKTDDFLEVNKDLFKLEGITLEKADVREGSATQSVRYEQKHQGIPVYGAQLVIGLRKQDTRITSAINKVDYEIPATLGPDSAALSADEAVDKVHERFDDRFGAIEIGTPTLFIYRHMPPETAQLPYDAPPIRDEMLGLGTGKARQAYLVWQVLMDTQDPDGNWELLVDAVNGDLVAVKDRRRYATRKGYIFWPDPVSSSQNDTISWNTSESTLNGQRVEVDLENLNSPVGGKYKLNGSWVKNVDKESPTLAPPETTGHFKYGSKADFFLNAMAYYYLDRLIMYLRSFGVTAYNNAVTGPIEVDPQAENGADNSHFHANIGGVPYITHGKGGVPDASDPGVITHEYGHAVHHYLLPSNVPNSSYEEGFNDFLAACWLDRYNTHQFQREEVFPWDNCPNIHWDPSRRVNLTARFDDSGFSGYGFYFKGDIMATALWDLFLNIGGDSSNENVRKAAADAVIHLYLEMLVAVQDNDPVADLINGLITADDAMTGGLYKKVIWDAFQRRGLWSDFTPQGNVDLYIRDSSGDTGEHASPQVHWHSPDIWVRNNPPPANPNDPSDPNYGEDPDAGHQPPINNVPNYMYARVHNRGSQQASANTFSVEAFHCNPGTGMLWPNHFQSMGTLPITAAIPANGSVRVGPFIWTPQIQDHECLLAVVHGTSDPAISGSVIGPVDHWKLVRFDNNVGQRNVSPQNSVLGGKTKTSFLVRGTTHPSTNSLSIDASALPSDTKIQLRVARSMTDQAVGLSGFTLSDQNSRWSTLDLTGGTVGIIEDFPLGTNDERSVTLDIDFSYQAQHLQRYPIVASQEQDGVLAGQLTIEITAVKESEDYVYGNRRSKELHTLNCIFQAQMSTHNKVPFATVQDGLARGYNGCAFCLAEYNTG